MRLDGLWTVQTLLALSSLALGNLISNEPQAAPRVFISFKGKSTISFIIKQVEYCFVFPLAVVFAHGLFNIFRRVNNCR